MLITDIKMPFMDGLQLCKLVSEHMPWVKVIMLSVESGKQRYFTHYAVDVTDR